MGPNSSQKNTKNPFRVTFHVACLICGLLLVAPRLLAQSDGATAASTTGSQQQRSTDLTVTPAVQAQDPQGIGSISGTVLDATGAPISGAQVKLILASTTPTSQTLTAQDGHFSFANVAPGPFELSITSSDFKTQTVSGTLPANQSYLVPAITLALAPVVTEVSVQLSREEIAQEQIKEQEQQRILTVIPNFYASYVPNAAPLNPKQKFELAWKSVIDPTSFVIAGVIAGGQQANNTFADYGQGAAGFARRFGAAYGDFFIGTYISNAILPSILRQDPRYFYKGTGTTKSRILYAISMSVMAKGDNGRWQPNYSGILGSLAAGGISNLYYPEANRNGFGETVSNALIGIGTSAAVNILQEFVFRKLTPKTPKTDHPTTSAGS
ncbi:MAG TPA: carboxypeptidase-like regulatory domain-containing protein [Terriglobales bacterium]|nr:carboxypeptidase-like regulatory domain-containing protein [Terriglobales bacterium]